MQFDCSSVAVLEAPPVDMSCVKYRKEVISFLRGSQRRVRHGGGQDEVSSVIDRLVGSS